MAVVTQFQFRRGTAAQWTSANPTLASGEFGYETDTGKAKIGNGSTAWNSLAYALTGSAGTVTSITAGTGLSGGTITGSGTIAIDSTVATLTGSQTLSNKTLTAPKFADLGFIADANGNELIIMDTVTSAVNEITVSNAAAGGNGPTISATGDESNININIASKGTGTVRANGIPVVTTTGTQTLTNKTLTDVVYTQAILTPSFSANAYTLALTDQGDILLASNGSTAGTVNIPTNASVAFPTGTQITVVQTGSGQLTIQASTPATTTIASTGATSTAPKLRAQNSAATLIKTGTDTWYVIGDVA